MENHLAYASKILRQTYIQAVYDIVFKILLVRKIRIRIWLFRNGTYSWGGKSGMRGSHVNTVFKHHACTFSAVWKHGYHGTLFSVLFLPLARVLSLKKTPRLYCLIINILSFLYKQTLKRLVRYLAYQPFFLFYTAYLHRIKNFRSKHFLFNYIKTLDKSKSLAYNI